MDEKEDVSGSGSVPPPVIKHSFSFWNSRVRAFSDYSINGSVVFEGFLTCIICVLYRLP